jgi:hypothetical protein
MPKGGLSLSSFVSTRLELDILRSHPTLAPLEAL